MARKKCKVTELSVFKGREAKLNRVLFEILANQSPQATWDIFRQVAKKRGFSRTKYAVVNTRVKALKARGYLSIAGERDTKQGGETDLYEMTARAQLAMALGAHNMDDLVNCLDEDAALTMIGAIFSRKESSAKSKQEAITDRFKNENL